MKSERYLLPYLRKYFISGLLIWIPIWATIVVITFLIGIFDNIISLLPRAYRPDAILGFHIPGIGIIITLSVIVLTGAAAANFAGKQLVRIWDAMVNRIPLVRTIHSSVKQILETFIKSSGPSFRKVLLVEFPQAGVWSIAFQTSDHLPEINNTLQQHNLISVFIPMTPNISSGFLVMLDKTKVVELNMSIDQALKFVISLGVVQPPELITKVPLDANRF